MLKFSYFGCGYLTSNGSGEQTNEQVCIPGTIFQPHVIVEVSFFKKQHVSGPCTFGEVVHVDADTIE